MKIQIVTPVIHIFRDEIYLEEYVKNAMTELLDLSNILEINIDTIGKFPVIIKYFQDNSSEKSKHFPKTLTFEIEVPTSYDSIEIKSNSDEEISKIDKIAIYESVVADSFREQIFYF